MDNSKNYVNTTFEQLTALDGEWTGLDSTLLMQERHIAVAAPALLERADESVPIDLNCFTLLHVLAGEDQRYLTWQHWLDAARIEGIDTDGGYEFDVLDLSIKAAIDGLGITIADRNMIGSELASGQLRQVLDVQVEGHQSYWFVLRPEQRASGTQRLFQQWLQAETEAAVAEASR
jgi:LysR family transcriptional regulator, glycine cleavage system transcriptional activator